MMKTRPFLWTVMCLLLGTAGLAQPLVYRKQVHEAIPLTEQPILDLHPTETPTLPGSLSDALVDYLIGEHAALQGPVKPVARMPLQGADVELVVIKLRFATQGEHTQLVGVALAATGEVGQAIVLGQYATSTCDVQVVSSSKVFATGQGLQVRLTRREDCENERLSPWTETLYSLVFRPTLMRWVPTEMNLPD